jgi:hypothetical protein
MVRYEETLTLRDARARYFAENGFVAPYNERWVKVRFGRLSFPVFPNTPARIAATRLHDLHHVVTEYDTSWVGEGEIGAWELGSGCGPYLVSWVMSLSVFGIGCVIAPRRTLRAFVRGRHSRNFYRQASDATRMEQRVGDLRRELGLDQPVPTANGADLLAFSGWVALGALYGLGGTLSFATTFAIAMYKSPPADTGMPSAAPSAAAPPEAESSSTSAAAAQ